jgi:hypothetical protein
MAFGKVAQSTEAVEIKRYVGVAPVKVLAVNPDKATLEKYFNTTLENEPTYTGDNDGIKYARVDFLVQTDAEKCGVDMITRLSFYIRDEKRYNRDKTKIQVIDEYGRTAWATADEFKEKRIPIYSNGSAANISNNYRACLNGEEYLTNFVRTYLNIPNVMRYVNNTWIMIENPSDAECRFDNIKDWFDGKFTDIKDINTLMPENKVKVLFGVKNAENGNQYQDFYNRMFLSNGTSRYERLQKEVTTSLQNGSYPNTEFEVCAIKEYVVNATPIVDNNNATPEVESFFD